MVNDEKGFSNKGLGSSKKKVGGQGLGGEAKGSVVPGVNNPRGMNPKRIGGGRMPLVQSPVQPNVGRAKKA